jgi:hypothetical protein
MRLVASLGASLARILEQEMRAGERAITRAVRAETERLKAELRQQVVSAFGARGRGIANAWRERMFPQSGESVGAAGIVWTKVPSIIDAFERDATIRARGGRFLVIPAGFNPARGRRGRGNLGVRVTPQQMVASRQAFLRPFRSRRVAREKRRTPRNALAFWDLQIFAFARSLPATGEKLANPLSR